MMSLTTGLRLLALALVAAGTAQVAGAATLGETTFQENCSACHQKTGLGVKGAFPALAGDKFVMGPIPPLAATVLNGRGGMPTFKSELSDAQIAAALTYVRSSWGNKAKPVTPAEVAAARKATGAASVAKGLQMH
jgi:mono/diheme cytochrome c family protein